MVVFVNNPHASVLTLCSGIELGCCGLSDTDITSLKRGRTRFQCKGKEGRYRLDIGRLSHTRLGP